MGEREATIFKLACLATKARNNDLAVQAWQKYLCAWPHDARAHFNLGSVLNSAGQKHAALASFKHAFELDPTMVEAASNAAGLLIRMRRPDVACTICHEALREQAHVSAALLYNLNTALRMANRLEEAIAFAWLHISRRLPGNTRAAEYASIQAEIFGKAVRQYEADGVGSVYTPRHSSHGPMSGERREILSKAQLPAADDDAGVRGKTRCPPPMSRELPRPELTVVCVRWGTKYSREYVTRLARGVSENLKTRHKFVCYTDDVEDIQDIPGVEARSFHAKCSQWRGWWLKAYLFSREAALSGRILYVDLDTVVTGSMDDIAGFRDDFGTLSVAGMANENRPRGLNSSIMIWNADGAQSLAIVHDFLGNAYDAVTACVHKFDHWLEMTVRSVKILQEIFPGQIVEYKADCCTSSSGRSGCNEDRQGHDDLSVDGISGDAGTSNSASDREPAKKECFGAEATMSATTEGVFVATKSAPHTAEDEIIPVGARIVCFPLHPKPHDIGNGLLRRKWLGHCAEAITCQKCG